MIETNANLGISFDGDADRVIFSDPTGKTISGDQTLALCAIELKQSGRLTNNSLVATTMSNLGLDEAMQQHGISVQRTGIGDRRVLQRMRQDGLSFGGENSGHLIFSDFSKTGDGILAALQVCKQIVESGKSLAELAAIVVEYPSKLLNIPVANKLPLEEFAELQSLMTEAEKEMGKKGRFLIRYSGTENKIRILVEHQQQETVKLWIERFQQVIEEVLG